MYIYSSSCQYPPLPLALAVTVLLHDSGVKVWYVYLSNRTPCSSEKICRPANVSNTVFQKYHLLFFFCVFSLLSGAANGVIAIHDLDVIPPTVDTLSYTYPVVCSVAIDSDFRHRGSVETAQWYPFDTGMFVSSGTDKLVKVWDTNVLRVSLRCFLDVSLCFVYTLHLQFVHLSLRLSLYLTENFHKNI